MARILAVGDIHTKLWILDRVEKLIPEYDGVVFCGDYTDDWSATPVESIETCRLLQKLCTNNVGVQAVIGNHDYSYLHDSIAGRSSGWNSVTYALMNAPENRGLRSFMEGLPITLKVDGVTYSHAGLTEEWSGNYDVESLWDMSSPIWARPWEYQYRTVPQVIGHNPRPTCEELSANVWCVDTFSTYPDGKPIGDGTVLEVIDGEQFNKIKL